MRFRSVGGLSLGLILLASVVGLSSTLAAQGSGGINAPEQRDKPYVILVSLDGFKPEYLERFDLPNFQRVTRRGTRAKAMRPVFPSLTFPNHYSMVTGLYPQNHGIVSNRFYDPVLKDTYVYSDNASAVQGKWYGGEPIWVTAETQGMVAACYFWPGSEAPIKGIRPTIYNTYSDATPDDTRVRTVLKWLRMPVENRPHMITLYFSHMDSVSHANPLDSPAIEHAALSLDATLGKLLDGIEALPLRDRVYLILTSDHGMVETSNAKTVQLTSLLGEEDIADLVAAFSGPVANLHVREGVDRARQIRDRINAGLQHGKAYLRTELPERFHHRENPRSGDVVVVMEEAWGMSVPRIPAAMPPSRQLGPAAESRNPRERPEAWGAHGWDPSLDSMQALFLAMGPGIRQGATVDEVRNVDVYPFIAQVLGLKMPKELDGRPGHLKALIGR